LSSPRSGPAQRSVSPRLALAVLGAITLAGLALRLPSFGNSLFGDELSSYFIVSGHSIGQVLHLLNDHTVDLTPPLYYLVAWLVERVGDSAQALRLVPLLAGVAAIPLTYELGRSTVGRRAGIVGAAVMAFSPYLIFYSTEARAYALVMVLLLGSTLALLTAVRGGGRGWWAAYAVCSCAAMYTHYTSVFVLLAQFIWAAWSHPEARVALVGSNLVAAIGFAPWLPVLVRESNSSGTNVIGFLQPFGLGAIREDLGHWAFGHPYLPLASVPGPVALSLLAAGCVASLIGIGLTARSRLRRAVHLRPGSDQLLPVALAVAMPIGLIVWSSFSSSVWDVRNLIASWPGLAVVLGALVTNAHRLLRPAAAVFVTAAFVIGGLELLGSGNQRPDYRAAAAFIDASGTPGAPIADLPGPSPGPLSELDAALARYGPWMYQRHPVLRIGQAPLAAVLRAAPYATLPVPAAAALAAQAAREARGGKLVVVSFGAAPASAIERPGRLNVRDAFGPVFGTGVNGFLLAIEFAHLPAFVAALPAGFRLTAVRTFPGFLHVSVYVFQRPRRALPAVSR
jgi:Dolichyl-phosphate-mannose-protein mannosyltransferase